MLPLKYFFLIFHQSNLQLLHEGNSFRNPVLEPSVTYGGKLHCQMDHERCHIRQAHITWQCGFLFFFLYDLEIPDYVDGLN